MKKRRRRKRDDGNNLIRVIRLWTRSEATQAFPYIRSITHGLREDWLAAASHDRHAKLLAAKEGRPDRDTLMAIDEAQREKHQAMSRFDEAVEELADLDVFCLHPVRGVIWIPFRSGDELAWFIFDAFDRDGLLGWRFHNDDLEMIRPVSEMPQSDSYLAV